VLELLWFLLGKHDGSHVAAPSSLLREAETVGSVRKGSYGWLSLE